MDLTRDDIDLLQAALNAVQVAGVKNMERIVALHAKLETAKVVIQEVSQ